MRRGDRPSRRGTSTADAVYPTGASAEPGIPPAEVPDHAMPAPSPTTMLHVPDGLLLLAGLWLIVAPLALGYSDSVVEALWNGVVVGVVLTVLALVRVVTPTVTANLAWVIMLLGGWLVVAPFVLGYSQGAGALAATWNDAIVGVVVLASSSWSAVGSSRDAPVSTGAR